MPPRKRREAPPVPSSMLELYTVRELGVRLRPEVATEVAERAQLTGPHDVANLVHALIGTEAVECFAVVLLNIRDKPIATHVVSRGTLTMASVAPREVFRVALVEACASIVVAHNHPSGDPTPSHEDRAITERLREAGKLLGVELLDHVIVTPGDAFYSFAELAHSTRRGTA